MARLKLGGADGNKIRRWRRLTDRVRDGAIETPQKFAGHGVGVRAHGLPIGFAMARLKRHLPSPRPTHQPRNGLPIGFAMARLKRPVLMRKLILRGLTDRVRDGAIETLPSRKHAGISAAGLPIGFAMARLKLESSAVVVDHPAWLTDRVRDGAIETPFLISMPSPFIWLTDRVRDGAIETLGRGACAAAMVVWLTDRVAMARLKPQTIDCARALLRGLPIGFAMARLKPLESGLLLRVILPGLTDRVRDGAIETPLRSAVR